MLLPGILTGLLVGLSLGALGGGGSVLAVPALVYLLGQTPVAATTGSLLVVGVSAVSGAYAAWRQGNVYVGRGLVFGAVGVAGAGLGATWSTRVDPDVLLGSFAALMLVVAGAMVVRLLRDTSGGREDRSRVDGPIITVSPTFFCNCPRAVKVLVTATAVGLVTGFFGVGGGFLVVPALVLALGLPVPVAAGTSLLVIAVNSAAAFGVRVIHGTSVDWGPVLALTGAAVAGSLVGARVAAGVDPRRLSLSFALLLVVVAAYTGLRSLPGVGS